MSNIYIGSRIRGTQEKERHYAGTACFCSVRFSPSGKQMGKQSDISRYGDDAGYRSIL